MSQTKYDILQQYKAAGHNNKIRDSWVNLGSSLITENTKTYIQDMIYKIDLVGNGGEFVPETILTMVPSDPNDPFSMQIQKEIPNPIQAPELHGALVLCEVSAYGQEFNWEEASVDDETQGLFSFNAGVITPYFRVLLFADEVAEIIQDVDPEFIPYTEMSTASINISQQELDMILLEVGVPFLQMEELEFTQQHICDLMIKPAMQEYFKFFPIVKPAIVGHSAGSEFRVEMPEGAYGAVRAFVNNGYGNSTTGMGNPLHFFANEVIWSGGSGGTSFGRFGTGAGQVPGFADLNSFGTMSMNRAVRQGINNYSARFHFRIEQKDGKRWLVGYSNKVGPIEVHWAYDSNDWNDIDYARVPEVRKLATSKVLRALGMLRSQVKIDIPGQVDFNGFVSRADALEQEVMTFWKEVPQVAMMRGSM